MFTVRLKLIHIGIKIYQNNIAKNHLKQLYWCFSRLGNRDEAKQGTAISHDTPYVSIWLLKQCTCVTLIIVNFELKV